PSFTVFPNTDVFFTRGTSDSCPSGTTPATATVNCNPLNSGFSWNHGYYGPEIDTTWAGLVGPGVAHRGLDGPDSSAGPGSAGNAANGTIPVPDVSGTGTGADHTDLRPPLLALVGLKDDYVDDGRVLTEDLTVTPGATSDPEYLPLAQCYKQLNSSVGQFGTDVLEGDTAALKSGSSADDSQYQDFLETMQELGSNRDQMASTIKQTLFNAEFNGQAISPQGKGQIQSCQGLLKAAASELASASTIAKANSDSRDAGSQVGVSATSSEDPQ